VAPERLLLLLAPVGTGVRGKGNKLGEREGNNLGDPCPKVRLSQDRCQ